jgi:hypothetical protein
MRAVREETLELRLDLRRRVRPRDAERIEAVLARGGRERLLQRCRIAQKSRSA